ncbi:amino acid adenylation domain-containing protein [Fulvivirga sp. 29W222]|uniref:Amino acid adenylation domain-containing protein n=1 Tax=Fulvivirga marina TaxID=2494733 RepID=A0A937G371_9BACT|nr:non-ribosomal peptide synthetase [Fulvivirga marina]MBL6449160.1 amino acid adenylation domain-containing protein [Fulvivirga marina]
MKISSFKLVEKGAAKLPAAFEALNQTATDYPDDKTVSQLFEEIAGTYADKTAFQYGDFSFTYKELDERSNQVANFLVAHNIAIEEPVAVLLQPSDHMLVALLGILKAGGTYVSFHPDFPFQRLKYIIEDTGAKWVISEKKYLKLLNKLQWECPSLESYLCLDTDDLLKEDDEVNELGKAELWDYIGQKAADDIQGGGWVNSYTGEDLSRKVMDEYGDNILHKLKPLLKKEHKVLEIGCSSGISMFRLAPLVKSYYGVDHSEEILKKTKAESEKRGLDNIFLQTMSADEISSLKERDFDVIIINSVIQCFNGHNYLYKVLESAMELVSDKGLIFIGDIMDQDSKDELIQSLKDFKAQNPGKYTTKLDWSNELFISRNFFNDLQHDFAAIDRVEHSEKIATVESELTQFRFDTMLHIDRTASSEGRSLPVRNKRQYSQKHFSALSKGAVKRDQSADNTAYITYTSGTTGVPKGVLIRHKSINRLVRNTNYINITPENRIAQTAPLSFDASTFEIWGALLNGASLHLIDKEALLTHVEFGVYLKKYNVNTCWLTASLFNNLVDGGTEVFAPLKTLLVGGEALSAPHISKVRKAWPDLALINGYGPTENTTFSTTFLIDGTDESLSNIPIGKPIANSQCYIVKETDYNQILPPGIPGELCVSGDGLAKGYLNDPELTAEKFVPHPFKKGEKLYRTGDRARLLPDGNIQFIGRVDEQVKVRGYRIELKEIENQLGKITGVKESAIIVEEDEFKHKRLVAYVVHHEEHTIEDIKAELSLSLPGYMVPQHFIPLEALPLTDNGKLNRKLLPKVTDYLKEGVDLPTNDTEKAVAEIWKKVLDIPQVGIHDNFFEIGGHSLKATQVTAKVEEELGVKVSIKELFLNPTIKGLSEIIAGGDRAQQVKIERLGDRPYYEASYAQRRLWVLDRINPDQIVYNMPGMSILKNIDKDALNKALLTLIERHEVLRTTFITVDDEPMQKVHNLEDFPFKMVYEDLRDQAIETDQLEQIAQKEAQTPFNLEKGPLFRVKLLQLTDNECAFIYTVHHIVSDGWSMGLMVKEVLSLYEAFVQDKENPLPELPIQYRDYAHWQKVQLSGAILEEHKQFWLGKLQHLPAPLELPTDFERPSVQSFDGGLIDFELTEDMASRFEALCNKHQVTLFMGFLSVVRVLLYKYTGQTDMTVGSPVSGRVHRDLDNLIGFFVNMIAIRGEVDPDMSFKDYLSQTKAELLETYDHQVYPYDQIVSDLHLKRDMSRNPLFDVVVTADINNLSVGAENTSEALDDTTATDSEIDFNIGSKFDLLMRLIRRNEGHLQVHVRYNSNLFKEETVLRLKEHLLCLFHHVLNNPDTALIALNHESDQLSDNQTAKEEGTDVPSIEDNKRIQKSFNNTQAGYPQDKTLIDLFDEQVNLVPDHVAVQDEERSLTYQELSQQASAIASFIKSQNVGKKAIIGLLLDNSIEAVVSIFGVLRAGCTYLPIDSKNPYDRVKLLLNDTDAPLLITQKKYFETVNKLQDGDCEELGAVLYIDSEELSDEVRSEQSDRSQFDLRDIANHANAVVKSSAKPQTLAYIIYTSGSTGTPKGCMITHENVVRLIRNDRHPFSFSSADVWVLAHAYNFDFSVWEIFGSLLNGSKLMVPTNTTRKDMAHFARFIKENKVTVLNQTPLAFKYLSEYLLKHEEESYLSHLKCVIFGGDRLEPATFKPWIASYPLDKVALINMYGITETTVHVTYGKLTEEDILTPSKGSPIGVPLPETTVYVCDKDGNLLPTGVVGEMFVGGTGVCNGYFNNVKLTAERFIINPSISNERLYRTGDTARWLENGTLEFFGRIDNQVKIRGYRIELGEIQRTMLKHPAVKDAHVMAPENKDQQRYIVGYYIANGDLDNDELRRFLTSNLPEYMVPSYLTGMDKFPLSTNGKINAKALPLPHSFVESKNYQAPTTAMETSLVKIWQDVLGINQVGILDDFFELGGDSIKAIRICNKIQELTGDIIHITLLFESPSIKELATSLLNYQNQGGSSIDDQKEAEFRNLIVSPEPVALDEPKNKPAVFILSPPRSGSTLFRAMLSGHPMLFAPPELELMSFNTLEERKDKLEGPYSFFLEGTIRALMELNECDADLARDIMRDLESKKMPVKEFYALLQKLSGDRMLVDKSPNYTIDPEALTRMETYFESPKYLVLQRHPYGMINSFENTKMDQIFRYEHPFTLRELAELTWLVSYQNIQAHLENVPASRKFVVQYEDLVREPESTLMSVCDFLEIPYEKEMLEIYAGKKSKMLDGISEDSKMIGDVKFATHQGIDSTIADRWKDTYKEDFLSRKTLDLARSMAYLPINGEQKASAIEPVPAAAYYEVSHAQKRMWILNQFEEQRSIYNSPAAMIFQGLNLEVFKQVLAEVVQRHEILRTTFTMIEGDLMQQVHEFSECGFDVEFIDLSHEAQSDEKASEIAEEEAIAPFDLEKGPLLRAKLVQLEEGKHLFVFNMHHIISDGWSLIVLIREMTELYNARIEGAESPLAPLHIQYKDYAHWQNQQLRGESLKVYQQYWHNQFKGELPLLDLPTDFQRPRVQTFKGDHTSLELDKDIAKKLKTYSQEQQVSLFATLLSLTKALFYRYTGQEDIIVGTPSTGRNHRDLENQVGLYFNTLGVRSMFRGNEDFGQLLKEVNKQLLNAQKYQIYPFDRLIEELELVRDVSRSPLFDVMVTMQNIDIGPAGQFDLNGVKTVNYAPTFNVSKFDLSLVFKDNGESVSISAEYNVDLFKKETIERMLNHLGQLALSVLDSPQATLDNLDYIPEHEKEQLRDFSSFSESTYPEDKPLHALFEEQVLLNGEKTALITSKQQLTYLNLHERSNKLANYLIETADVQSGDLVGVLIDRSENMLITLLGILKAGAAYVPVDKDYPLERIDYICQDSGMKALITNAELQVNTMMEVINLKDVEEGIDACPSSLPAKGTADSAIYCLYTSGSTGKPKGVLVNHRSVVNFLTSMKQITDITADDRMLATTTYCFDISVLELFLPLVTGATVILADDDTIKDPILVKEAIEKYNPDIMQATPTMWKAQVDAGWQGSKTLKLLCGGEALSVDLGQKLLERSGALFNMYGPTETTIWSTYKYIKHNDDLLTIGRPIANTGIHILDAHQLPTGINIPGELCISGAGLAHEYMNRLDLTAEKFITVKTLNGDHERLYRTGDQARWLPSGDIGFMGRLDNQVKVRGHRIELKEIEHVLLQHPDVDQAIVTVKKDGDQEAQMVAYFITTKTWQPGEWRSYLNRYLPEYMIPAYFIPLDEVPLTSNGKVDHKALPDPVGVNGSSQKDYVPPRNALQSKVLEIWTNILGKTSMGIHDNFFELGGHSLKATQFVSRIRKEMNADIRLSDVFLNPTIESVSACIAQAGRANYQQIEPVAEADSYEISYAQRRLWILNKLQTNQFAYNMPGAYVLEEEVDKDALDRTFKALIERHETLRTTFIEVNGEPRQKIHSYESLGFSVAYTDLRGEENPDEKAAVLAQEESRKPFDLTNGPLIRVSLLQLGEERSMLLYTLHHIIADGWSLRIFFEEAISLYMAFANGRANPLQPLKIQYKDYVHWQNNISLKNDEAYWMTKLSDLPDKIQLPYDFGSEELNNFNGAVESLVLNANLREGLQRLAFKNSTTLSNTVFTILNVLLQNISGQNELLVGTASASRNHVDLEGLIGFFVNPLVILTKIEEDASFEELLQQVTQNSIEAFDHQNYPFDLLVEKVGPKGADHKQPIFNVFYGFQNFVDINTPGSAEEPGKEDKSEEISEKLKGVQQDFNVSRFDLTLFVVDSAEGISLKLEYNSDQFKRETIKKYLSYFEQITQAVLEEQPEKELHGAHEATI